KKGRDVEEVRRLITVELFSTATKATFQTQKNFSKKTIFKGMWWICSNSFKLIMCLDSNWDSSLETILSQRGFFFSKKYCCHPLRVNPFLRSIGA
ncbi:MAG: hypothetical protein AABZ60_21940, partial [Planctomycetota bacterium]